MELVLGLCGNLPSPPEQGIIAGDSQKVTAGK